MSPRLTFIVLLISCLVLDINGSLNKPMCCPLTTKEIGQNNVIKPSDNGFKEGHDPNGVPLYMAYTHSDKGDIVGKRMEYPVNGKSFFYPYAGKQMAPDGNHMLLTNDNQCIMGWQKVSTTDNHELKDDSNRHYPEIGKNMFAKMTIRYFNNRKLPYVGKLQMWGNGKKPSLYYTCLSREFKHSGDYEVLYTDCKASVFKLIKAQLDSIDFGALEFKKMMEKKATDKVMLGEDSKCEMNTGIDKRSHEFKDKEEYTSSFTNTITTKDIYIDEFNIEPMLTEVIEQNLDRLFKEEAEDPVKIEKESEWRKSGNQFSKTMTYSFEKIYDIEPQQCLDVDLMMDVVKEKTVPYTALFDMQYPSTLAKEDAFKMLEGIGIKKGLQYEGDKILLTVEGFVSTDVGIKAHLVTSKQNLPEIQDAN